MYAALAAIMIISDGSSEHSKTETRICTTASSSTAGGMAIGGKLVKNIGVRSSDNTTLTVISANSQIPARGFLLLTTSSANQSTLHIDVLFGNRFTSAGNAVVGSLVLKDIEKAQRGYPQFSLRIDARAGRVRVQIKTMHASSSATTSAVFLMDDIDSRSGAQKLEGDLPAAWRFENPYSSLPHPGFCVNHRFLTLSQRDPSVALEPIPQERGDVLPSFTASKVWPAAYAMVAYLESLERAEEGAVSGKRLLELGAGTGLVGLAAAALGASQVVVTDLSENLELLRLNIERNQLTESSTAQGLDWTAEIPPALQGPWDIVLAADCVFWEYLFEPLVNTLTALLKTANSAKQLVLISVTHRFGRTPGFLATLGTRCRYEKVELGAGVQMANTDIYSLSLLEKQQPFQEPAGAT